MELKELTAISPVDGRYRNKIEGLDKYFSEFALIKYRVRVEIEYLITLTSLPEIARLINEQPDSSKLREIYANFSVDNAMEVKTIEKTTNHDVKAVEYFIKDKLKSLGYSAINEYVHFGLTSQDVNNTATPLLFKEAVEEVYLPRLEELISKLDGLAEEWKAVPMLARTHGQPASPTKLGKEVAVFSKRLKIQKKQLEDIRFPAKFGGATGNFNAHHVTFPGVDWNAFGNEFVEHTLGLSRSEPTTQIEHYDNLAALFDVLKRINTIMIDIDRDFWTYISMDYFKQEVVKGEVGSSAMPHKVNPIDFENSEGNLGIANAVFEHLAAKLPVSRLQRDLTDSTVLRNIGVPVAHSVIAINSLLKGLGKVIVNQEKINGDLENNWAVVAEAIQTILRRENYPNPYEALKDLTRGSHKMDKEIIHAFIDNLEVGTSVKQELKKISPSNYTGIY